MEKSSVDLINNAKICLECPVCNRARKKQKGLAYLFVKLVDRKICPKCQAYEQVFKRRAYEPVTQAEIDKIMKKSK